MSKTLPNEFNRIAETIVKEITEEKSKGVDEEISKKKFEIEIYVDEILWLIVEEIPKGISNKLSK